MKSRLVTRQEENKLARQTLKEMSVDYSKQEIKGIRTWLYCYPAGRTWLRNQIIIKKMGG